MGGVQRIINTVHMTHTVSYHLLENVNRIGLGNLVEFWSGKKASRGIWIGFGDNRGGRLTLSNPDKCLGNCRVPEHLDLVWCTSPRILWLPR